MGYRLKPEQESFTITDGPLAGTNYAQGVEYPKIPKGFENRFEPVEKESVVSPSRKKPKDVVTPTSMVPPKENSAKKAEKTEEKGNES